MRRYMMMSYFKLGLILGLFLSVSVHGTVESDGGFEQCEYTVKKWASSSFDSQVKDNKHALRDLLFFLHVPRTGGRTYFHCFLKKLYSNAQECPRSYDKLRFNPRKANCRLLSTHDDYSMMSKLPKEKTSVVTILRNPIDRVFSTYEFSIEVAARFLIHPNLTSVAKMAQRVRRKTAGVSTLDIWPWKYLVPWMREDLFARRDERKLRGQSHLVTNDPYDMEDILMPLHDYINNPIARDIVHNGATFQIAGLTNNSYSMESHEVRHCVLKYQTLGEYVLEVAKKRLDSMLYVGLTENHKESATMFANVVGAQVLSQHIKLSSDEDFATKNVTEQTPFLRDTNSVAQDQGNETIFSSSEKHETASQNSTAEKLIEAYGPCISSLRNTQAERRVNSLKRISPANFTKEARRQVSEALIQEIASLNSLDVELYKYAEHLFMKQQTHMTQSMVHTERLESTNFISSRYPDFSALPYWRFISIAIIGVLMLFVLLFVNARRRTSKIKL